MPSRTNARSGRPAAKRPPSKRAPRLRVGYFGAEGTFSHAVADARFSPGAKLSPYPFMTDLVEDLGRDRIDYAILPIENSIGGWVVDILDVILSDAFHRAKLQVVEELHFRIVLSLIGHVPLERAKRIYSHRYPLRVAREWLHRVRPDIEVVEVHNTADSADRVADDHEAVALTHRRAAELRGVPILLDDIPVSRVNATRFFAVGKRSLGRGKATKTAICLQVADRPGALHHVLEVFAREHINLCRLHSHAIDHHLEAYWFFMEIEQSRRSEPMRRALAAIREHTMRLKVVGSFPTVEL